MSKGIVKPRDQMKAAIFESQVRELLKLGRSVSSIAKTLNRSYKHTKRVADRIKEDLQ